MKEVSAVAYSQPTFASWAAGMESSAGLAAGTLAASPATDYNKDGIPNLMAYALGLSAVSPSAAGLPLPAITGGSLRLNYSRSTDRTDITLTPEISTNLQTWFPPGQSGAPAGFTDTLLSTAGTVESRRASIPATPGQKYYLRLRVTKL